MKTKELLDCALIGVCAVIRLNTVLTLLGLITTAADNIFFKKLRLDISYELYA